MKVERSDSADLSNDTRSLVEVTTEHSEIESQQSQNDFKQIVQQPSPSAGHYYVQIIFRLLLFCA